MTIDISEKDFESTSEAAQRRGFLPNVSTFAFTATLKPKTMQLIGEKRADGAYAPFSLYSMRQAIEERLILDVLRNYATYHTYWSLLKTVADDPNRLQTPVSSASPQAFALLASPSPRLLRRCGAGVLAAEGVEQPAVLTRLLGTSR